MELKSPILNSSAGDNFELIPSVLQFEFGTITDALDSTLDGTVFRVGLACTERNHQYAQCCEESFAFHQSEMLIRFIHKYNAFYPHMKHPTPVYAIEPGFDDRAFAFGHAECKCLCISILGKSLCPF
jgi:hypothetical protein